MIIKYKISFIIDKRFKIKQQLSHKSVALPSLYKDIELKRYSEMETKSYMDLAIKGTKYVFSETVVMNY